MAVKLYFQKNRWKIKKTKIRNQYNQVPHLTRDTIWEGDKNTWKLHTQENQEVSPFPAGDHKHARNRHYVILGPRFYKSFIGIHTKHSSFYPLLTINAMRESRNFLCGGIRGTPGPNDREF